MSWPLDDSDIKKIAEHPGEPPFRVVSYQEYKVLEYMAKEGMLDKSGYPKAKFWDKCRELMKGDK